MSPSCLSNLPVRCNRTWAEHDELWVCGTCSRYKAEIVRRDRSGQLFGQVHRHHDHMQGYTNHLMRQLRGSRWSQDLSATLGIEFSHFQNNLDAFLTRFYPQQICMDCNDADTRSKRLVGADQFFSFAPTEIRQIIQPIRNSPPELDKDVAERLYAQQLPNLMRRKRLGKIAVDMILSGRHWGV